MSRTRILSLVVLLATAAFAEEVSKSILARNITTTRVPSASLGQDRMANVLLPLDYDHSTDRYPVLYLLHGLGDDQNAWAFMTNLSGYAARHRLIVVMPDAGRSFYVNSAADPKARFEDFIVKDLVEFMDATYRTIPLRRGRAIAGLSMGGYGAMLLGLKHSDTFSAIGAFSGALGIGRNPASVDDKKLTAELQPLFGGTAERKDRDPFEFALKVPAAEMPLIYIACGGQDFLLDQNRAFVALLASNKIPYEYREISPRVHSWDFWDEQIPIFLDMIDPRPPMPMPMRERPIEPRP